MSRPVAISAATLKSWLENPATAKTLAVVDVRDEDYIGGHIKGAVNVPSTAFHISLPTLTDNLTTQNKEKVVFHCMLSQQRGPSCASAYVRHIAGTPAAQTQEVYVLRNGFSGWAREYGKDSSVTEGFASDLYD